MDRGTDPNSIAVELITLVTKTSSYFSASCRWGLVSFKDLTGIAVFYHEIRQFSIYLRIICRQEDGGSMDFRALGNG
jgi:hypothetical protein